MYQAHRAHFLLCYLPISKSESTSPNSLGRTGIDRLSESLARNYPATRKSVEKENDEKIILDVTGDAGVICML